MGKTSKRIIAVLCILLAASVVFAGGKSETTEKNGVKTTSLQSSVMADATASTASRVMANVGNALGEITASVSLALHPFPQVLLRFYDFTKIGKDSTDVVIYANSFSEAEDLVSAAEVYTGKTLLGSDAGNSITTETVGGETVYVAKLGSKNIFINWTDKSERRWSVVAMLFGILLAAEVVFTAVFGYVMPEQEGQSLFKMVATKVAKTVVLFALCAALPFLLEAIRYGLFKVAETYQDPTVHINSMFEMPQVFMKRMANLVDTVGWKNDANIQHLRNSHEEIKWYVRPLVKLLLGLLWIVFEFVVCIELFKVGMHIVMNIIEVYLLLAVVMILLPFSIFTPTKSMVQGCTQTLFMNLLECFVIMVTIIMVVPACEKAMNSLYALQTGLNSTTARVSLESVMEAEKFKDAKDADISFRLDFVTQGNVIVLMCSYTGSYTDSEANIQRTLSGGAYSYPNMTLVQSLDSNTSWTSEKALQAVKEDNVKEDKAPDDMPREIKDHGLILKTLTENADEADYTYLNWDTDLAGSTKETGNETFGSAHYVTNIKKTRREGMAIDAFCQEMAKNILIRARRTLSGGHGWKSDVSQTLEGMLEIVGGLGIAVVGGVACGLMICASAGAASVLLVGGIAVASGSLLMNEGVDNFSAGWAKRTMTYNNAGETYWIMGMMNGSSRSSWRAGMMQSLREEAANVMMNEQATESEETSLSNDSIVAALIIAWIVVMLPCYFVKQSSQITNGLRSGYVGFESFANSTQQALHSMARGMGAMTSLVSKGVGMISKGAEMADHRREAKDNHTIAETLRKGDGMSGGGS